MNYKVQEDYIINKVLNNVELYNPSIEIKETEFEQYELSQYEILRKFKTSKNGNLVFLTVLKKDCKKSSSKIKIVFGIGYCKYRKTTLHVFEKQIFTIQTESKKVNTKKYCGVYLMKCDLNGKSLLKIGKSKDVCSRHINLTTANPDIELVGVIQTDNYTSLEKQIHRKFSNFNYKLEWFHNNHKILKYFREHPSYLDLTQ